MAWHRTGDKSLPEPVMIELIDVGYDSPSLAETKWPPFSRRHFQLHFFNESV